MFDKMSPPSDILWQGTRKQHNLSPVEKGFEGFTQSKFTEVMSLPCLRHEMELLWLRFLGVAELLRQSGRHLHMTVPQAIETIVNGYGDSRRTRLSRWYSSCVSQD